MSAVASGGGAEASSPPALEGSYRWEAVVAVNEKAVSALGTKRMSIAEEMKKSGTGMTVFHSRVLWTFSAATATIRFESVYRLEGDETYYWSHCEGTGPIRWKEKTLIVATDIVTRGAGGTYSKSKRASTNCEANIGAGEYEVLQSGDETMLQNTKDGATAQLVFVKDDSAFDVRAEAQKLSGYTD